MQTIDVRTIPPRERHPTIFGIYEKLTPGDAFILVNDHDPKPLLNQFQVQYFGHFQWEYLEQGPEFWRVKIGRKI